MRILPRKEWYDFSNLIILHGRKTCIARRPKCQECVLNRLCPSSHLVVPSTKRPARRSRPKV
jgi:endonuclease-3